MMTRDRPLSVSRKAHSAQYGPRVVWAISMVLVVSMVIVAPCRSEKVPLSLLQSLGGAVGVATPTPLSPVIGVYPVHLNFHQVCLDNCGTKVVKLFNAVSDPASILIVSNLTVESPFALVAPPATPFSIPGDGSAVNLTVRYCPPTLTKHARWLTISSSNATNSPHIVPLIGSGRRCIPLH